MICVSIGRTRHRMMLAEHKFLAERGAELVEFRLDYLGRTPDVARLLADRPTPCVMTCRRPPDRGRWRGDEDQRMMVLRTAIISGADYVDLEEDIAGKVPRYGKTKRIVSYHNFDETPADLEEIHAKLCKLDPDIVKTVTMANSPADTVRMLKLVAAAKVPTVGFCMGELGIPSRLLCGKYGSPFTYATFSKERQLAPGQLAFEEMQHDYHYDRIGPQTQIFGVVGDPVAHSLSPQIHNAAFRAAGFDGVYLPFRVFKEKLKESLDELNRLDIRGYSVTIPHKQAALAYASKHSGPVQEIGAANTLYRVDDTWHAANTDYDAALDSLLSGLKRKGEEEPSLAGKRVLMLGAGGVARAVGLGVVRGGGKLTIANRSSARAKELAESLGCLQTGWENRASGEWDIIVNCTAVGMHPDVDETPFPETSFREPMLVFDTVYTPENTLFLKQARARGCQTVAGTEMFVRQAAAQYERFTGQAAPVEEMLKALRQAISPVNMS